MFKQKEYVKSHFQWGIMFFFLLLFILTTTLLSAQKKESYDSVLASDCYVEFKFQNDFFFKTDYYYSNGLVFNFIFPDFKKSPISRVLIPVRTARLNYYGISIEQALFTPVHTYSENVSFNDRPYSSVLYVGHKRTSFIPETRTKIVNEIIIGVIGRYSFGYDTQAYFHRAINNDIPAGWSNQVANDLILNYEYDIELEIFSNKFMEFIGKTVVRAGTLYDDALVGMKLRLGYFNPNYTGFGQIKTNRKDGVGLKKFQIYASINPSAKMVVYNGTLQGGLFNKNSPFILVHDEIKPVVLQLKSCFVLQYSSFQLQLESTMLSPEFIGGRSHKWASVGLQFNF